MRKTLLALMFGLLMAGPAAAATLLWGPSAAGDSQAKVAADFPKARPPAKPDSLNGADERLQFKDKVFDEPFRVRFFFDGDSLRVIQLEGLKVPRNATAANMARTKALLEKVKARYGGEPVCKEQAGMINLFGCNWVSGDLEISVSYIDVSGDGPLMIVALAPAEAAAAN